MAISVTTSRPVERPALHAELQTVALSGGVVLAASAFGNGLSYCFGIFLARLLGPAEFGLYALGLSLFNVVSLGVLLGLDTATIRFVSHYLGRGEDERARSVIVQTGLLAAASGLLAGAGLALLAEPIATRVYGKPELASVLTLLALGVPAAALSAVLLATLQAYRTVRFTVLIKYLWEPLGKFLLAAALIWAGFGLAGALAGIVVAVVVSAGLALRAITRQAALDWRRLPIWREETFREMAAYTMPLSVSAVLGVVAPRTDILVLGLFVSAQDVGVYQAAFQTAAILALVLGAFELALVPLMGSLQARDEWGRLRDLYQAAARLVLLLTVPLYVPLLVFGDAIVSLFGSEFIEGVTALVILASGQMLSSGAGSANNLLLMTGRARLVMWNTVLLSLVLILTAAAVIPVWGLVGAAVAAASVQVLGNAVRVLQVWRLHRMQPFTWGLWKPLVGGLCACAFLLAARGLVDPAEYPLLALLGLLVYGATMAAVGLEKTDLVVWRTLLGKVRDRIA